MKSNKPRARQAKGLARSQILKAMPQITINNAHGHTVTISGDYNNLVSYLMHMRLLVCQAEKRYVELEAYKMAERANQDWELLYNAIKELRENQ